MINGFDFFHHMDSMGYDIICIGKKPLIELQQICKSNKRCIAFNTLGYLKFNITSQPNFKKLDVYTEDDGGLYVFTKRYNKMQNKIRNKMYVNFDNYTFYPSKDSPDYDLNFIPGKSIGELKQICDTDPYCAGFNTLGFFKHKIRPESDFINLGLQTEGLYVKNGRFRVKMLCDWCPSKQLCDDWNRQSKGNYRWNDIEITWEDDNVDFYVIINKPLQHDFYIKNRTIVFHMEPWCGNPQQSWGVKTWGEWASPDESKFLQIRSHENYFNNGFWQLKATYNDLKTMEFEKTKLMSSICSSKYFDPGHVKRIDFLKFIESKNDDVVKVDIYNSDNVHNFKGYVGPHPPGNKDVGISPYKYYFMPENNEEINFMTEKIWEPLLTETVAFYWGCPNLSDYIDPRSYILLDLNDFEKSFHIIKSSIINDEWSKRIDIIRMEKQKVLEYFQFFPTLERIIHKDFKFDRKPSDKDVEYHKYFNQIINKSVKNIAFIDNITENNENENSVLTNTLTNLLKIGTIDYIYVFNYGKQITRKVVSDKIKIVNCSKDTQLHQILTLNSIKSFCGYNVECDVLYLNIMSDSNLLDHLTHYLLDNHEVCTKLLNINNLIGCGSAPSSPEKEHEFVYNGWWAKAEYINKLSKITNKDDIKGWVSTSELCNKHVIRNLSDNDRNL